MKLSEQGFTRDMFIESGRRNNVSEELIEFHTQKLFGDKEVVSLRDLENYMIMKYGVTLEDLNNMAKKEKDD